MLELAGEILRNRAVGDAVVFAHFPTRQNRVGG